MNNKGLFFICVYLVAIVPVMIRGVRRERTVKRLPNARWPSLDDHVMIQEPNKNTIDYQLY